MDRRSRRLPYLIAPAAACALALLPSGPARSDDPRPPRGVLTGRDAFGDWTTDAPGVRRRITVEDLTKPYDTPSADNHPKRVERPEGAWPKAPEGFEVTEFARG